MNIDTFADSDWGGNSSSAKSTSGFAIFFGGNLISWSCKKQSSISLSTMEAEYIAMSKAATETMWLHQLIMELWGRVDTPTMYCDNQAAVGISKDLRVNKRSRHINIKYHHIRELVDKNEVKVENIRTKDNVADIFTKGLPREAFNRHKQTLGVSALFGGIVG